MDTAASTGDGAGPHAQAAASQSADPARAQKPPLIALVGNPNAGKTSLFNALTGLRQKVGNYPGVTVERKEGICFNQHGHRLRILDLPGAYSLNARSPDEIILLDALLGRIPGEPVPDGIICCVDAGNLERNLFLTTQVLALGRPTVIALNMTDIAERRGLRIDANQLGKRLGVPVIPCQAHKGIGIVELRLALSRMQRPAPADPFAGLPLFAEAVADLSPSLRRAGLRDNRLADAEATLLLAGEPHLNATSPGSTRTRIWQQRFDREMPGWRSQLITARYAHIGELMRETVRRFNPNQPSWTENADRFLLHPVWGFATLGAVMGLLFYCIFSLAAPLMETIDNATAAIGAAAGAALPPGPLNSLLVDGVLSGVGAVVIFLPQILLLFFFISMLESTGYMARAAFILDRLMSKVGLHGRSFIPLLSSYACAVPGIMATRTIESPKDRLATILVAPFMTCSARLPVYLVMIAALLPDARGGAAAKAGLLLGLYVLGTATAFLCALLFKKTLLRGPAHSMVMELPDYKMPQWRHVLLEMFDRARIFVRRAGTIIFALSILLWFAMNYPQAPEDGFDGPRAVGAADDILLRPGASAGQAAVVPPSTGGPRAVGAAADDILLRPGASAGQAAVVPPPATGSITHSFAGRLGHALEPIFAPIGFDWKISMGVIASFAAREVFVSTLAIVFAVEGGADDSEGLVSSLRAATRPDGTPLFTPLTCLSVLIFFVYALQCMSTIAVARRETQSWRWPLFMFGYMFALAWTIAFAVYQGGRLLGFT
jgi:ferrous iron transport protein B